MSISKSYLILLCKWLDSFYYYANIPKTRTLIDNIFSNNYKDNQKQDRGIIYADLSDHCPIYNISKYINKAVTLSDIEKKEDPCWLLLIFLAVMTDLKNPNEPETDAQTAYDCFHINFTECYK